MRQWDTLTATGQIRRLRSLAISSLESFPIRAQRLRLVGGFTNILFRVDTDDGPYALRVDLHQDHSDGDVENELAWLAALKAESTLDVARFVPAIDGRSFVCAESDGVPGMRRCVLFEWIPGKPLSSGPTEARYSGLGQLSAGLHLHGAGFTPPNPPLTWNKVFYWPEEVDPVIVFDEDRAHFLSGGKREILDRSIVAVEGAFARLDPSEAQTIHGDLHPDNVHVYRSRVIGLDFEDITWGHRVQDVATTLFYERDHPGYADFKIAFEEGYRSIAPWPVAYDGELEHFWSARTIMFVNYVANLLDDPSEYYEVAFKRLGQFLARWGR